MDLKVMLVLTCFFFAGIRTNAQNTGLFFKHQCKLSAGPGQGQPPLFGDFKWSKGMGASAEYNHMISKKISLGCEFGFTFDTDYHKTNFYNFYYTTTGALTIDDITENDAVYNFMRTTYSIIPQISYHFVNKNRININLTGGIGLMSENFTNMGISSNGLYLINRQYTLFDFTHIVHFSFNIDYKINQNLFVGLKVQDHIFSTEEEFRSLRASIGYVIQ